MKNILPILTTTLLMLISCSAPQSETTTPLASDEFLIEGILPTGQYEGAILYLVPMYGPHPRPVDSTFVAKDGRFSFRGNIEQMAVLRVERSRRMGIQELLIVTEPGITKVVLDSVSSAKGTPQNELLQRWKEHMTKRHPNRQEEGEFYYQMLKESGRNTASIFINQYKAGDIDSLKRSELNELLKDTNNYQLPQPGFHR